MENLPEEIEIEDKSFKDSVKKLIIVDLCIAIVLLIIFSIIPTSEMILNSFLITIFIGFLSFYFYKLIPRKYFVITRENIEIFITKLSRVKFPSRSIIAELYLDFSINWADINKIIVKTEKFPRILSKKEKVCYILTFIGDNIDMDYDLLRFKEEKQIEILLYLEQYAKELKIVFIETASNN